MPREEPHVVEALVNLAEKLAVRCIVQVGAFDGWEAYQIALRTGARAIAIEADHRCTPCDPSLAYFHAVIGATDHQTDFFLHAEGGLSGHFARQDSREELVSAPQHRLDTFCRARGIQPDALLIDTEGSSLEVLEGAGEILDGVRLIYAECQTAILRPGIRLLQDVDHFLQERGFVPYEWGTAPSYSAGPQGNFCWIRP